MNVSDVMSIPPEALGRGTSITVEHVDTEIDLYHDMANLMFRAIVEGVENGRPPVFIVPVGPVGQYRRLARLCNQHHVSCRESVFIMMDEYLDNETGEMIDYESPLSFRRFLDEEFYERLNPENQVAPENRLAPDPKDPGALTRRIEGLGGVDICLGGIGIVGHVAFNEPPAPEEDMSAEAFGALATRVVQLDLRTRVINSVTAAKGNIEAIPKKAVTVGMKEILGARKVRIYMNREWQPAIARRWIHGPVTPQVPASLLQRHDDVRCVMTPEAARLPQTRLR